jgi:hypothetical protein
VAKKATQPPELQANRRLTGRLDKRDQSNLNQLLFSFSLPVKRRFAWNSGRWVAFLATLTDDQQLVLDLAVFRVQSSGTQLPWLPGPGHSGRRRRPVRRPSAARDPSSSDGGLRPPPDPLVGKNLSQRQFPAEEFQASRNTCEMPDRWPTSSADAKRRDAAHLPLPCSVLSKSPRHARSCAKARTGTGTI